MTSPTNLDNDGAERRDGEHAPRRTSGPATEYVEPGREGVGILWWTFAAVGLVVIAGLVGLAVWAANEDDENRTDVAGVQSEAVDINDDGFAAQQAEIDIGDAVELTNEGSEDCALAANGAPVTVVRPGQTFDWSSTTPGRTTLTCEGRSGELQVTVNE